MKVDVHVKIVNVKIHLFLETSDKVSFEEVPY